MAIPNFFSGLADGLQTGIQLKQRWRSQDQADRRLDQDDRRLDMAEEEFALRREKLEGERELADAVLGFELPQPPIVGGGAGPSMEEDPERDVQFWKQAGSTSFPKMSTQVDTGAMADTGVSALVMMESSGDPAAQYSDEKGRKFLGLFQMGTPRLETLGVRVNGEWDIPGHPEVQSDADYLADPAAQKAVFDLHRNDLEERLEREGLFDHVGETVSGVPITRTGLLYAAHLGGVGGARALVKRGAARSDELGTSTLDYLRRGAMVETNMAQMRPSVDDVSPMQRALSAPSRMVDASEWPSQFYGLDDMLHDGERDAAGAKMDMRLAYILDDTTVGMRTAGNEGFRLDLTSGTRSPEYNRSIGGARNSQHSHGRAVDLSTANLSTDDKRKLVTLLVANGARGIGTYENGSIHVDVRDRPGKTYEDLAVWYGNRPYTDGPKWFQDGVRNGLKLRRRRRKQPDDRMRTYQVASSAPAIPDPESDEDVAVRSSGKPKGGLADRLAAFVRGRGGGQSAGETLMRRQLSRRGSLGEGPFAEPAIPTEYDAGMLGETDPVTGITTRRRPMPSRQAIPMIDEAPAAEEAGEAIPMPEEAAAEEPAIAEPEAEEPAIEEPDEREAARERERDENAQRLDRLRSSMGGGYDSGVGLEVRQVGWDGQWVTKWQRKQLSRVRRAARKTGDLTLFSKFEKRLSDQINTRIYRHLDRAATFLPNNPERAVEEMKKASFYIDDGYIPVFDVAQDPESGENAIVIRNFNARTGAPEDPVVMNTETITKLAENEYATEAIRDRIKETLDIDSKRQDLAKGEQDMAFAEEDQEMDVNNQIAADVEAMATIQLPPQDEPKTYGEKAMVVVEGDDSGAQEATLPVPVIERIKTAAQQEYWSADGAVSTQEAATRAMQKVFTAIGDFRDEKPEEFQRVYAPYIHDMYLYEYDTGLKDRQYKNELFSDAAEGAN